MSKNISVEVNQGKTGRQCNVYGCRSEADVLIHINPSTAGGQLLALCKTHKIELIKQVVDKL